MAEEVRINLTSSADTSGIDKMGAAVGGISGGAEKAAAGLGAASKSSKELGSALGKSVEVGGAATSLMTNLATASQGGASGFFAAGRAILSFGQIVKGVLLGAGPVGIAVAAIGLLAGAVFALKDAFKPAGESVDDFKKRLADLDKANLRALDATISALSDRLKATKEEADAVRASLDKIDDAEMAAQLAAVKKSDLTAAQKDEQDLLIRDEFKKRREGRQRDALTETASGARETRDTLAPEFEDARQKYGDLLNERDRILSEFNSLNRLYREASQLQSETTGALDPKWVEARRMLEEYHARKNALPSRGDREKLDSELASARDRFQGSDGKGGIAAQYQAALKESEKAERALARFNDELKKVGEWDRARIRIENNGTDPRDTEAAARQSPGRNRLVGADGRVVEYESSTVPTINQQIVATTEAMRLGGGALPQSQPGVGNQVTFGALKPGSDTKDGAVARALKDTATATKEADTGADTAKQAEELKKAAEAQSKAQQAAQTATMQALGAAKEVMSGLTATTNHHTSEIAMLRSQISALRSRA